MIIFSPVIIWNAGHEWVSFLYQGRDRVAERFEFFLPYFILSIILIMTPTGFLSVIAIIVYGRTVISRGSIASDDAISKVAHRGYHLIMILTLLPVILFAGLSLFRETKFHWTAPCWLGVVPYMALIATRDLRSVADQWVARIRRAWPATIMICLISYGAVLHYLGPGFPGVPYPRNLHLLGWQDFGRDIEVLVERFERETGDRILVVGMDRNRIASGLAFYRTTAIQSSNETVTRKPALQTSSWHLFGGKSLMYEYWFPKGEQNNKTMLLVSRSIDNLTSDQVRSRVRQMGDIKEIKLWKNGRPAGRYYYSLVNGYQSQQPESHLLFVTPSE
jgi:dolichol-phosphate mannosyltransferase